MKRFSILLAALLYFMPASSQLRLPEYPDSFFSTYYWQRVTHFHTLPQSDKDIIFLGNSITDGAEWYELFNDNRIKNRGISGGITAGVIHRLRQLIAGSPSKIFLLIGVNDLARSIKPDSVVKNISTIATFIKQQSPGTKLYVQSLLPVNEEPGMFAGHVNKGKEIAETNAILKTNAGKLGYVYVDINTPLSQKDGRMSLLYTNDGLHLNGAGYMKWQTVIYPYVFDAEQKPALIPLPQQLEWKTSFFTLFDCESIVVQDTAFAAEAEKLRSFLSTKGFNIPVNKRDAQHTIEIRQGLVNAPRYQDEAYRLEVTADKIILTANTSHGIFNGIQTLKQLMRDGMTVPSCFITDWPSYQWRGYLSDVGRNFIPVDLLKQQIEVMAAYKLNVFHFHFTEDIAWRLAFDSYPQLTDAATMIRNKGRFYTKNDLHELIRFCEERHIMLLPEIDMPGHSAAFKRAMGFDMQSDSGLAAVKNILKEFFETYDLPYIHIGADEVEITMKNFLPEVIQFIKGYDKIIIGWEPGGNFTGDVIRQLWLGNAKINESGKIKYIDSKHLYLNHMDPLEAVTTIFFRKIGDRSEGNDFVLGATLCTWPDRRVETPQDIFSTNPVYPGIVTFAEKIWRGGGFDGWTAAIGHPESPKAKSFAEFENRLTDHQHQYFSNLSFPYQKQSSSVWDIYGPYDNGGNLSAELLPETAGFDVSKLEMTKQETGGTLVLRHWWYPDISGVIDNPKENTTVYAHTRIWSDTEDYKNFWIGFNNISRSPDTDSPPPGAWDNKYSEVWVNHIKIDPPQWNRAGMKGNSEIPLIDEGYEYRQPNKILLKKGWNDVWIKAPVASFRGTDWHNPVKWMFTFVEV